MGKGLTPEQIALIEVRREGEKKGEREAGLPKFTLGELQQVSAKEPPIYVTVNRQHNLIVVRTSDQKAMKEIEKLIMTLDRPTPQVLLEIKVLKLTLGDDWRSIFDMDLSEGPSSAGPPTSQPRNPLLGAAASAPKQIAALGNFSNEGGNLIYQFMSDNVRSRIQLLSQESRIESLATPHILCANNEVARIFVGQERPITRNFAVITDTTQGVVSQRVVPEVETRDIGTTLFITPRINADKTVTLNILQDTSTVTTDGAQIPVPLTSGVTEVNVDVVNTSNLEGTVVVKNALTLALGGLIQTETSVTHQKVPFLGDLPLIGKLFRRDTDEKDRVETVLLVTPYVIMTPEDGKQISEERMKALSGHAYFENPSEYKPVTTIPSDLSHLVEQQPGNKSKTVVKAQVLP